MRIHSFLAVAVSIAGAFLFAGLCGLATDTHAEDVAVKDAVAEIEPTIVGKWRVKTATMYGNDSKAQVGHIWEFGQQNQLTIRTGGRILEARYELNKDQKPWQVDVETEEDRPDVGGGGPRKGIVSIKGERLTLCLVGGAGAPRPEKMRSTKESLTILREMERVKNDE